jgi:hypothetical protein
MTTQIQTNGLDLNQIQELVGVLQADPSKAQTVWRSRVQWKQGFQNEFQSRSHAPIAVDEPQALSGTDTGPNPAELLLGAMGTCLSIGYALNATARGITIEEMELELDGDIDLLVFTGLKEEGPGLLRCAHHRPDQERCHPRTASGTARPRPAHLADLQHRRPAGAGRGTRRAAGVADSANPGFRRPVCIARRAG